MGRVQHYLDLALGIALKEKYRRHSMLGAVAIRKDGCVVCSNNIANFHPNQCIHAESRVLKKAGMGAVLFVARVTRHGEIKLAKPCRRCMAEIKNRRVRRVYYTIDADEYGVVTN